MVDILIDAPRLRNRHGIFMDRIDAGRFLADMLQGYKRQPDSMVLAIFSDDVTGGVEIAPSFLFLASDDYSYITGQILHPNGSRIING